MPNLMCHELGEAAQGTVQLVNRIVTWLEGGTALGQQGLFVYCHGEVGWGEGCSESQGWMVGGGGGEGRPKSKALCTVVWTRVDRGRSDHSLV